jgi:hypothetical protein
MVLSAWYEMGMHVHKKGLEERLQPQVFISGFFNDSYFHTATDLIFD